MDAPTGPPRRADKPPTILIYWYRKPPFVLFAHLDQSPKTIVKMDGPMVLTRTLADEKKDVVMYSEENTDIKVFWKGLVDSYLKQSDGRPFTAKNGRECVRFGNEVRGAIPGKIIGFKTVDDALEYCNMLLSYNFTPTLEKFSLSKDEVEVMVNAELAAALDRG